MAQMPRRSAPPANIQVVEVGARRKVLSRINWSNFARSIKKIALSITVTTPSGNIDINLSNLGGVDLTAIIRRHVPSFIGVDPEKQLVVIDGKIYCHYYGDASGLIGKNIKAVVDEEVAINYINVEGMHGQVKARLADQIASVRKLIAVKEGLTLEFEDWYLAPEIYDHSDSSHRLLDSLRVIEYLDEHKRLGTTLRIIMCDLKKKITINVKMLTIITLVVKCFSDWHIKHLKDLIQYREDHEVSRQRLLYCGQELDDMRTLSHYNIAHGDTIILALRMRGC